jgi:exonuclease VII small subunit
MSETENLSFEEAFSELEEVVQQLEAGDLTLATRCNAQLDAAELRVQQLVPAEGEYPSDEGYDLAPFEEHSPD